MLSPPAPVHCCTTVLVAGSILEIGIWNTVAQTKPSPNAISPPVPGIPTGIAATNLLVFVSTREIVLSPWLSVHTQPAPTVRKRGCGPTGTEAATLFDCTSTRVSRLCSVEVIQIAPSAKAGA